MPQLKIVTSSIESFSCDVLVLKYAQGFFGADAAVAAILKHHRRGEIDIAPQIGDHSIIASRGDLKAPYVLFVGVVPLFEFDYAEIRAFSRRAMEIVRNELPDASHIAMTVHGVNYGLDERESFLAQLGGIMDAWNGRSTVKQVTIVEQDAERASRLRKLLRASTPQRTPRKSQGQRLINSSSNTAGIKSRSKPHIFVAMPFVEEMEDVFIFGIQSTVNSAGYLCERIDMTTFTGDILERIKSRIDTAALVIADLSGGNPNVYLEVGYAWGRGRSTLLLAREGDSLKFDVRGQRCLLYKSIADLAKKLSSDLAQIELDDRSN
jgi:hypothetical protein